MNTPSKTYNVEFVNNFEGFSEPLKINFSAQCPEDVKAVVKALYSFYSGDHCQYFINGQEAMIKEDAL